VVNLLSNRLNFFVGSVATQFSSVRPLCSLCLCGELSANIHHRDTEITKVAQRFQMTTLAKLVVLTNPEASGHPSSLLK